MTCSTTSSQKPKEISVDYDEDFVFRVGFLHSDSSRKFEILTFSGPRKYCLRADTPRMSQTGGAGDRNDSRVSPAVFQNITLNPEVAPSTFRLPLGKQISRVQPPLM